MTEKKIQTAVNGTEQAVTTNIGKIVHRKIFFGTDYVSVREKSVTVNWRHLNSENYRRVVDGKCIQWNGIPKDELDSLLKLFKLKEHPLNKCLLKNPCIFQNQENS